MRGREPRPSVVHDSQAGAPANAGGGRRLTATAIEQKERQMRMRALLTGLDAVVTVVALTAIPAGATTPGADG
jgi:hypothetical protein